MPVLIDRNRRTAIVLRQGRTLTHLVPMEEGELRIRSLRAEDLAARAFQPIDYPERRAARQFLKHAGGVSKKARKALASIARGRAPC